MSRYLCLCGESVDPQTKLPSKDSISSLHAASDLYFCPRCHALKCVHCCTVAVECKYCPSCMSDYSDTPGLTRCTKNCFSCPECSSALEIEITDLEVDACRGKRFTFHCVYCTYTYQTRFISKPTSLATIVRQERVSYFSQLHTKYTLRRRLCAGHTSQQQKRHMASAEVVEKMRQLSVDPAHVIDEQDSLVYRMEQITPRSVDIDGDFCPHSEKKLPKGNHLAAKKSFSCSVCTTKLCVPVADPRSMKYLTKELAPDVVPAVCIKRASVQEAPKSTCADLSACSDDTEEGVSCTLSVVNPLPVSMNVTVSTLGQTPSHLMELASMQVPVALPVTSFTVGPRREKAKVLDAVPSVYLSDTTPASRAEKLTRAIRNEQECSDIEKGFNWVSMPVEVFAHSTSGPVSVCLYVTVETRAPQAWISSGASKKALRYGFWAVCEVEAWMQDNGTVLPFQVN